MTVTDDIATLVADYNAEKVADAATQATLLSQLTDARAQLASEDVIIASDADTIAGLTAQIAALTAAQSPLAGFQHLAWHDEFDGPAIDASKWSVDNGVAANNERANRWARNVTVAGGSLVIQPKVETTTVSTKTGPVTRQWTSGSVSSLFLAARPFYAEWRTFMPIAANRSAGFWPAPGWLRAGTGLGEIDVCECFELGAGATQNAINEAPHAKQTAHIYSDTNTGVGKAGTLDTALMDVNAWHTFGARVDADGSVTVYRDGAVFKSFPVATYSYLGGSAFAGGYRLLTTLQVGSTYYGTPDGSTDFSQNLKIDYARVWVP